jgi:pimeloyl-ACP methyl ester carboxylesterase
MNIKASRFMHSSRISQDIRGLRIPRGVGSVRRVTILFVLVVLVALAVLYQVAVVLAVKAGWRNPRVPHRRDPATLDLAFETVRIPTAGGKTLHGWWIPSGKAGSPCLVLVHGWGRNVERMLPWIAMLHPEGFDLLTFDARHHGSSDEDGYGTMLKFSEDVRAAVDYAVRVRGAPQREVGVLGLSVGGSAAIHAASCEPRIAAVATVGAFADPSDPRATIGRYWWVLAPGLPLAFRLVERRIGFRFRDVAPEKVIVNARARFLLIHGTDDVVVPVSNARRLAAAGGSAVETWILPGRGHSDPHRESGMAARLAAFFRRPS